MVEPLQLLRTVSKKDIVQYVNLKTPPGIYKNAISFFLGSFFPATADVDPFDRSFTELKTLLQDPVALVSKFGSIISQVSLLFEAD
jgi:hypothetical protein